MVKTVITYGTFDTFHYGHLELIRRISCLGNRVIVAVSTDEFNLLKGKESKFPFEIRKTWVELIKSVDLVIPETSWDQKILDIQKYNVDIFAMGDDWLGKFDKLPCQVIYLPRTPEISSTQLKQTQ